MTTKIYIAEDTAFDLDLLVSSRLLIQANSGAGKSYAIRRLLEQSSGKIQHIVIDPEGEFATLREKHDYVLISKTDGDAVADPKTAKLLAERLLELKASAIIDIYELNPRERVQFVRRFLDSLIDAPKKLWQPVLVVLDEAHVYCPEKGQAESADAVKSLCTRGRKRGFCAVLATQRLSKLHKDAAAECNNKLIGRSALDIDMRRASEELGFETKADKLTLRTLKAGEFYAFGPAITDVVKRIKIGAVQTTHAEPGGPVSREAPPPTKKVVAILSALSDLQTESDRREKTEADLKKEVGELKKELAAEKRKSPEPQQPKIIERKSVPSSTLETLNDLLESAKVIQRELDMLDQNVQNELVILKKYVESQDIKAVTKPPKPRETTQPRPSRNPAEANGDLTGPEQRLVDAIAWMGSIGIEDPPQVAVAFLARYKYGTGAYNNARGKLKTGGYVEYLPDNRIRLTDAGHAESNAPDVSPTTDELHERVISQLQGPHIRLLQPLLDAYPEAISNDDLATAAEYTPGTGAYNNARGRLKTLRLVEYPTPGFVRACDVLFPE